MSQSDNIPKQTGQFVDNSFETAIFLNPVIVDRFQAVDKNIKNQKVEHLFNYNLNAKKDCSEEQTGAAQVAAPFSNTLYRTLVPFAAPVKPFMRQPLLTDADDLSKKPLKHKEGKVATTHENTRSLPTAEKEILQNHEKKSRNEMRNVRENEKSNFLKNLRNGEGRKSPKIFINPDTGHSLFSPSFIYRKKYRNIDSNCFDVRNAQKVHIPNSKGIRVSLEEGEAAPYPYTPSQASPESLSHTPSQAGPGFLFHTPSQAGPGFFSHTPSQAGPESFSHTPSQAGPGFFTHTPSQAGPESLSLTSPYADFIDKKHTLVSESASVTSVNSLGTTCRTENERNLKPPRPQKNAPQNTKPECHQDNNIWSNFSNSMRRKKNKSVAINEFFPQLKRRSCSNTELEKAEEELNESHLDKRHSFSAAEFEKLEKKEKSTSLKPGNSTASVSNATSWFKKKYVSMQEGKQGRRKSVSCRDLGGVDCEGWLLRKKETSSLKKSKWKKWWCVLEKKQLRFYVDPKSKDLEGSICLPGMTVSPAPEVKTHKFAFKVFHSGSIFYFSSECREDMIRWMNKLSLASLSDFNLPQFQTISGFYNDETSFSTDSSSQSSLADIQDFETPKRESDRESQSCEKYSKLHSALDHLTMRLEEREEMLKAIDELLSKSLVTSSALEEHMACNQNLYSQEETV